MADKALGMNKAQATRILHRMYRVIEEGDLSFRFDRGIDPDYGRIYRKVDGEYRSVAQINPLKKGSDGGWMSTIIHEILHELYDVSEKEIRKKEKQLMKLLSDRQLGNLLKRVTGVWNKK